MKHEYIDLIVCIEGGNITYLATPNDHMSIRVIDYDLAKIGEKCMSDYECDATQIDVKEHTNDLMKEAKE